jgi:hypothetical protein
VNGTTSISSGTDGRLLFQAAGVVSQDADLTFVTDTLTATNITSTTLISGQSLGLFSNFNFNFGTIAMTVFGAGANQLTFASDSGIVRTGAAALKITDGGAGNGKLSAIFTPFSGTATAGTAPIKLTSGTLLTTPENGAMEYDGVNLSFTRESTTRQSVAMYSTVATNATATNTARQISTTHGSWVIASVNIATGVAGDGKVELMVDSSNPPTTVRGTFRVQAPTALSVNGGGQLMAWVPAGHYYILTTTDTVGTNTFTVVGNVQELQQ